MNLDRKAWFKCAKYAVLAVTVVVGFWIWGKMMVRAAARGESEHDAKPEAQKTAGEAFKNIQVLKDIPASELIPSMRYVAASLGVGCEYCHANGDVSEGVSGEIGWGKRANGEVTDESGDELARGGSGRNFIRANDSIRTMSVFRCGELKM